MKSILKNIKKEKLLNLKAIDLEDYIKQLNNGISLIQKCLDYVNGKDDGEDKRKEFLKEVPASKLKKIAPKSVLDPKNKKLRAYQKNTGIYLWKNGYYPKKFLGVGVHGVVWQCQDNKAVKVTCNKTLGPFKIDNAVKSEVRCAKKVKGILDNSSIQKDSKNKTIDPQKYLSISKDTGIGSKKHIFESECAKEDLLSYKKSKSLKQDFSTIVKMTKQLVKGLKIIHDAGYSHNDVKPENLLIVERWSNKLQGNKDAVKVGDFGQMTEINKTRTTCYNEFCAPDYRILTTEAVAKRDVYSAGTVALFLLAGENINDGKKLAKELCSKGPEYVCNKYKLKEKYCEDNDTNIQKMFNFLNIIKPMVATSYKKRITIQDALVKLKMIPIT